MIFVFVGAYSEVLGAGIKLTRFGQRVELPPAIADETKRRGGLPCIPVEAFDAIGFTSEELRKFGVAASHQNATPEFIAKQKQALEILHTIREPKIQGEVPTAELSAAKLEPAGWDEPRVLGTSGVK